MDNLPERPLEPLEPKPTYEREYSKEELLAYRADLENRPELDIDFELRWEREKREWLDKEMSMLPKYRKV
jgi:hypothetical protein